MWLAKFDLDPWDATRLETAILLKRFYEPPKEPGPPPSFNDVRNLLKPFAVKR